MSVACYTLDRDRKMYFHWQKGEKKQEIREETYRQEMRNQVDRISEELMHIKFDKLNEKEVKMATSR